MLISQILKLFAWEPSFEKRVNEVRARELKDLVNFSYLQSISIFLFTCAPFLVSTNRAGEGCVHGDGKDWEPQLECSCSEEGAG